MARDSGERLGLDALIEALGQLQGAALVASTLETELLPARLRTYRAADLDELCTTGDVVWVGSGALGPSDGRIRLYFADQFRSLDAALEVVEPPSGPLHDAIRAHLAAHGASFWNQLRGASSDASDTELLTALWDLVWAGEVTNDSLAPLRAVLSGGTSKRAAAAPRGRPRPGRLTRIGPPAGAGRWSLLAAQRTPSPASTEAAHATALQLLERYGVVTREAVLAEGVKGGYAAAYAVLKVLEERARFVGYFVAGLGAAQFAAGAVDRLRSHGGCRSGAASGAGACPVILAATDPAQPYGAVLDWPQSAGRPSRIGGATVLRNGCRWFGSDRSSHSSCSRMPPTTAGRGVGHARQGRAAAFHRGAQGRRLTDRSSDQARALTAAGFIEGYRGFVLRGV